MTRGRLLVLIVAVIAIAVLVALYNRGSSPTTTTTTATTSPDPTVPADATATVLIAPFSEMGPGWAEQVFPYGEGEELLGTSPGGDGLMLGPEYGTQTPDGSWWFLDAAKMRIAHFAADGSYLDQVVIPEELLVDGLYFQYQMPQGLDNGSITAGGFPTEDRMSLLQVDGGVATGSAFDGAVPLVTTDGELLYGLSSEGAPHSLDPANPVLVRADWLSARDKSRYMMTLGDGEVVVELPDAGLTRTLELRYTEDPDVVARGGIEVETGTDGTVFVLFYGAPESDETLGIGGFLTVGPGGEVSHAEPVVDPFSLSDPGSPSRLGVTPGTSTPWLMVVWEDGVHVFTRSG